MPETWWVSVPVVPPPRASSLSAHLDTVFPHGTDVRVRRSGTTLRGPGISDDCRGLAVLVAVARALKAARAETAGSLTFVATVGEEGLGNLRGVRNLFESELKGRVDRFLSIDGAGLSLVSRGVGSRRFRITFSGAGGHSYGSFGIANPIHALGRAIDAIAAHAGSARSEGHVQRGTHRRRDVGQCDRVRGVDGGGSAVVDSRVADAARSPDADGRRKRCGI